jgi:photosystem II stability/assembly factor-like uncharacterized protein
MIAKKNFIAFIAVICIFSFQACKKTTEPTPEPNDVVARDTLSAGWTKKIMGRESFSDIFFQSSTTGYLAGSQLFKTTDGGNNWLPVLNNDGLQNIFITNDNKAFFVGQKTNWNNLIIKTIDGGSNFINTIIDAPPADIFFNDNNNGLLTTYNNSLFKTSDGGVTWVKLITTGFPLGGGGLNYSSLFFINNTIGWVVNNSGIFRTNGSNLNWQPAVISGGSGLRNFKSIFATSATKVFAAAGDGEIFKSTDGGITFNFIKKIEAVKFTDIHFLDELNGYACGGKNVFKTTDGGLSWVKVVSVVVGVLLELHFTDANHGWVCGNEGTILIFKQ